MSRSATKRTVGIIEVLLALVTLGSACTTPSESPLTRQANPLTSSDPPAIQGYRHTLSQSRFAIGADQLERSEFGMQKTIGANGVFATLVSSGWAMGIPNANSPARAVGALSKSPDVHNQAVKDYFTAAGLPADQIGWISAHAVVHMTNSPDTGGSSPIFDWYTSVIARAIKGIPIPESFAWATINANNDVVEESVYWPDIPQSAVSDAQQLTGMLADPAVAQSFKSRVPHAVAPGQVVIHHTPSVGGTSETKATFDIAEKGAIGMAVTHHFDVDGNEIVLAADSIPIHPNSPKH
jgi:hypothetical protein